MDKKPAGEGESSKQSDSTAAVLADLPPGWNDEFLKYEIPLMMVMPCTI